MHQLCAEIIYRRATEQGEGYFTKNCWILRHTRIFRTALAEENVAHPFLNGIRTPWSSSKTTNYEKSYKLNSRERPRSLTPGTSWELETSDGNSCSHCTKWFWNLWVRRIQAMIGDGTTKRVWTTCHDQIPRDRNSKTKASTGPYPLVKDVPRVHMVR